MGWIDRPVAGLGLASDGDVVPGERDIRYVALDWMDPMYWCKRG